MMEISVVVPVYNSSSILPELVDRLTKVLQDHFSSYEIILVDDSSQDDSCLVIKEISRTYPFVKGFQTMRNVGQFATTLLGTSRCKGNYIVNIDDDLEYAPEDIPKLYKYIKESFKSLVFGISPEKYRMKGGHPVLSKWRNRFLNLIWNKFVTDSFRIFRRDVVFDEDRFLPRVHLEAFWARNVDASSVGYVEVSCSRRKVGHSNHDLLKKAKFFFLLTLDYWDKKVVLIFELIVLFALYVATGWWQILLTYPVMDIITHYGFKINDERYCNNTLMKL